MPINQSIPALLQDLTQKELLERQFHDALFPGLQYRKEAGTPELWPEGTGTEWVQTRSGLLQPITRPAKPGVDPTPQTNVYEQWVATQAPYNGTIDTHMPTASVAMANILLQNVKTLGLQAAQSMNRIPRNALFSAYLSGQTTLVDAALQNDLLIHVSSVNGFTETVNLTTNARPSPVTPANPLQITIIGPGGIPIVRNVIAYQLDDPNYPMGPGWLSLSVAIPSGGAAARSPVLSAFRPRVVRAGGGKSIDALSPGDLVTVQDVINAAAHLRTMNVPPHDDGFYHAHVSPLGNAQFFADPVFQKLNQSLPDGVRYSQGFICWVSGVMFFMNNESPNNQNSGTLIQTGVNAMFADDIGAEVVNETGVNVGRIIITGKGSIYERYVDEGGFITEAGVQGKVTEFNLSNNSVQVEVEKVRLILQAPQDRLQNKVAATWSYSGGWPVPTDLTAQGGLMRYRRAIVMEYAESLSGEY